MTGRNWRGIFVRALVVGALPASALGGCTGAAAPVKPVFSGGGISFTHERSWTSGEFELGRSPFIVSIAYLSNQPFDSVCTTSTPSRGITEVGCSPPIAALRPGGLVVQWWKSDSPGNPLATYPGRPATIAGHPARLSSAVTSQPCVPGTKRSMQATIGSIPNSDGGGFLVMTACLTRSAQIGAVMAMLESLKIDD